MESYEKYGLKYPSAEGVRVLFGPLKYAWMELIIFTVSCRNLEVVHFYCYM